MKWSPDSNKPLRNTSLLSVCVSAVYSRSTRSQLCSDFSALLALTLFRFLSSVCSQLCSDFSALFTLVLFALICIFGQSQLSHSRLTRRQPKLQGQLGESIRAAELLVAWLAVAFHRRFRIVQLSQRHIRAAVHQTRKTRFRFGKPVRNSETAQLLDPKVVP